MVREDLISANIELLASESSQQFAPGTDASRQLVFRPGKELGREP